MIQNYLKIAFRSLMKNKLYRFINIFGLAVGLAAVIMILLYLQMQLSYDDFHQLSNRLYRVSIVTHQAGTTEEDSHVFTPPIGPAMKEAFPDVANYTRISTNRPAYIAFDDKSLKLQETSFADSTFFDLFSFEMMQGNPQSALRAPYSIVLTKTTAERLFGKKNPYGEIVKIDNQREYQVTGVIKNPPLYSHLQFEALISFSTLYELPNLYLDWNGGNQYITYVQLQENARAESLAHKFPDFMWRNINETLAPYGIRYEPYLQPLADIHLWYNDYSKNLRTNLYVFGAVGLLILFIACVNFINLTTARATWRTKEVGVRKVLGANRQNLITQFLGESLLLSLIALILAFAIVKAATPLYQSILGEAIDLSNMFNWITVSSMLGILLIVGLLAGSYPAFYLSALQAVQSLKRNKTFGKSKLDLRNGLIVMQFTISIALIVCTLVVNRQLDFTKNKSLGFEKENMLILPLIGNEVKEKFDVLKQEIVRLPRVQGATGMSEVLGNDFTRNGYTPEGMEQPMMINVVDVDESFFDLFGIEVKQGKSFMSDRINDDDTYLVNESLVRELGWDNPLDKTINRSGDHPIIGVVEDFHFASLHNEIAPLIFTNKPWTGGFDYMALKLSPGSFNEVMGQVENVWHEILPQTPFESWFLDDSINRQYESEQRFQTTFFYFSMFSIFIALLGVLGLATFAIQQRTKEIGIRKVLGASVGSIVSLLSKDFLQLVVVAAIVAFPTAWLVMNRWLEDFAYRIEIAWWMYAVAGLAAVLIALLTVGSQAIRAAIANPVKSLRTE